MEQLGWFFVGHSLSWFVGLVLTLAGFSAGVFAGILLMAPSDKAIKEARRPIVSVPVAERHHGLMLIRR